MEKYSNVIMQRPDREIFLENLEILNEAFKNLSFKEIIDAANISNNQKVDFIMSFCKHKNDYFVNFLKILVMNRRLSKIPSIYQSLLKSMALENNIFYATIFTMQKLSDNDLKAYEERLSKHFAKNIKLKNEISNKKEVRVYLEDLGYEIIVSNDSLKQKLKEFIIKAV